MMLQLSVDPSIDPDILNAVQTILNVFAAERQNRDCLLNRIKMLETERQEYLHKRDIVSPADDSILTQTNHRKRIKTDFENEDSTNYDTSKDELNSAFHSSIISLTEDDVIQPTPFQQPYRPNLNKSKKIASPTYTSHCSPEEQNKENQNTSNPKDIEKSPTVLTKKSKKIEIKTPLDGNESPKWHKKTKQPTPRRIFDNYSTSNLPSQSKVQVNSSMRKKPSLSLGSNTTRLKQSTLNFQRYDDETYCEGVLSKIDDVQLEMNSVSKRADFQSNVPESTCLPTQYEPKRNEDSAKNTNDVSVAFVKNLNEVITIDESQSTQELYKHIADIKEELKNPTSPDPVIVPPHKRDFRINCPDCEEYHRMLGRDLTKDFPKKVGVCSRHRRNIQCADTPPGFWNPKIVDSDSEETPTKASH